MQHRRSMSAPYANAMAAWVRSFPALAPLFVVTHGFAVLIGWGYDLAWLRSAVPRSGSMIPGSAAASACLGLALMLGLARTGAVLGAVCLILLPCALVVDRMADCAGRTATMWLDVLALGPLSDKAG